MAVTAKTAAAITTDGITATYWTPDAVNDNSIPSSTTFLHVTNAAGAPITVSIRIPVTVNGLSVTSREITVTNGTSKFIPMKNYYVQSDGTIQIGWSSSTSITASALVI